MQYKDESLTLFALGHLSLAERVLAEDWLGAQKLLRLTRDMEDVPEELEGLERLLADTYFCNSLFQSIPDSWAVNQLFPIMPIHRLNEEPSRRASWRILPVIPMARLMRLLIGVMSKTSSNSTR